MPGRGGDGTIMRFGIPEMLVNIAHFQKFALASTVVAGRKVSRAAAEQHSKGDHAKGVEHSKSAQQHSQSANKQSDQANAKSQQQK